MKTQQFADWRTAEKAAEELGFNVAPLQRHAPRGLHRNSSVAKWRNLTSEHKELLHGVILESETGVSVVTLETGGSWPLGYFCLPALMQGI